MTSKNTPKGVANQRKGFVPYLKMVHSFSKQVIPLRSYLNDQLNLVESYHEPRKRQALLDHVVNTIVNHGNTGLKLHRGLFIQGVKVLGGDTPSFDGFKLDSDGYPVHYGDLFRILHSMRKSKRVKTERVVTTYVPASEALSDGSLRSVRCSKVVSETNLTPREPTWNDICKIKVVLSILKWPYSIKLELNESTRKTIMDSFVDTITKVDPTLSYTAERLGEAIAGEILPYLPSDYRDPLVFKPFNRTYKSGSRFPCKIGVDRIPYCLGYATLDVMPDPDWFYNGPIGRATVLSEKAGKTRVIVGYDGMVNSSNLYEKARKVLDNIPNDASAYQPKGHTILRKLTEVAIERETKGTHIISADLESFTDNLHLNAYRHLLELLNCSDFLSIPLEEIEVSDSKGSNRSISPQRLLMGLKGTFELASIIHHGLVHRLGSAVTNTLGSPNQRDYVICGDDLVMRVHNIGTVKEYERIASYVGLKINFKKTVISSDTGVFCGKVFFRGADVSPLVPPLFTFSLDIGKFVSAAGTFINSARSYPPGFRRAASKLVKSFGKNFRGKFIPYELPFKLGGVGLGTSVPLLTCLSKKRNLICCKVPDDEEPPPEVYTRRYPMDYFSCEVRVLPFTPNLLLAGFTSKYRKKKVPPNTPVVLKALHVILCYFYGIPAVVV